MIEIQGPVPIHMPSSWLFGRKTSQPLNHVHPATWTWKIFLDYIQLRFTHDAIVGVCLDYILINFVKKPPQKTLLFWILIEMFCINLCSPSQNLLWLEISKISPLFGVSSHAPHTADNCFRFCLPCFLLTMIWNKKLKKRCIDAPKCAFTHRIYPNLKSISELFKMNMKSLDSFIYASRDNWVSCNQTLGCLRLYEDSRVSRAQSRINAYEIFFGGGGVASCLK